MNTTGYDTDAKATTATPDGIAELVTGHRCRRQRHRQASVQRVIPAHTGTVNHVTDTPRAPRLDTMIGNHLRQELDAGGRHCEHCRTPNCTRRHATRPLNPTVSVVIAARNEEENVGWVASRLHDVDEIILVDGNSSDATIAAWQTVHPHVTVLDQDHPGKGAAVAATIAATRIAAAATIATTGMFLRLRRRNDHNPTAAFD